MADDNGTGTETGPGSGGDSTTEPTNQPQQTGGQDGGGQGAGDSGTQDSGGKDLQAEIAKWKALARKHEQRSRENSKAAERLAELEDANKTELQRLQERADKAERERAAERAERFRLIAASQHGLPSELATYLGDGEEDEITERAEALSKFIAGEADKRVTAELAKYGIQPNGQQTGNGGAPTAHEAARLGNGRGRPVESLRPGATPTSDNRPQDPNEYFRSLLGR